MRLVEDGLTASPRAIEEERGNTQISGTERRSLTRPISLFTSNSKFKSKMVIVDYGIHVFLASRFWPWPERHLLKKSIGLKIGQKGTFFDQKDVLSVRPC